MAFFSGSRGGSGGDKKKFSASEMFKQKNSGKKVREKSAAEKYQDMVEAKVQKMMEDAIMGKKKSGPRIPGTKSQAEEPPKELTKNAKLMLQMLAMKKIKADEKKEKKIAQKEKWAESAKKRELALAKMQKDAADVARKQADDASAAAWAEWSNGGNNNNNGW